MVFEEKMNVVENERVDLVVVVVDLVWIDPEEFVDVL